MVTTNDVSYTYTVRPKITFKTIDGLTTLFTYDAFAGSNPINVTYMDVEGAVGESGTFNITIEDSANILDKEQFHNCKVYIQLGKSTGTLKYFMIGFADVFTDDRPITKYQTYRLTGFGSAIQAGQLFIHRREASDIQNIDSTKVKSDPNFRAWRLAKSALENKNWRPLKQQDFSIATITKWATTGISQKVDTNIPVVNAPFTYVNEFMDQLCAVTGAVWFIDYTTGAEIFTLTFNPDLATGVTIKSGDLRVGPSDNAETTAYIKRAFTVEDSATAEAGVVTRLYTSTIIDATTVSSNFTNKGSTSLNNRAIAQQVIIDSDARRLDSIAFVLSKVGEPDSPESRVNGDIVLDKNNLPKGTILDTFHIPLASIETSAQTIFVNDISIKESLLEGGQKKLWLRLFQRSGITGDAIDDPANTVLWHHDGVLNANPVLTTKSGTAAIGEYKERDSLNFAVTDKGPTYDYSIFSDIRRLQARTNINAMNTLRLREQFISTDFLTNPKNIAEYLSLLLSQASKPRRSILNFTCTVPNNFIFKPYQTVSFVDGLSGIAQDLQVKRARYVFGSNQGDPQIGTLSAELTLGGLHNSLLTNCSCV